MTSPDWKTCTEGELWRFVAWHLEGAGIPTVLVGGAVVGRILRLLSPTDCVKDRLAGYIHWKLRDNFRQALLVARRQKDCIDFENLAAWCNREGGAAAYSEFIEELLKTKIP